MLRSGPYTARTTPHGHRAWLLSKLQSRPFAALRLMLWRWSVPSAPVTVRADPVTDTDGARAPGAACVELRSKAGALIGTVSFSLDLEGAPCAFAALAHDDGPSRGGIAPGDSARTFITDGLS